MLRKPCDLRRKVARSQGRKALTDQFVETELFQARHFNRAIQKRADGDPADRLGNVVSRPGLNEYRWQPNRRSVSGFIGDALDELEELRRLHDRVREPAAFDQSFLGVRRAEIGAVRYALRPHE